MVNMNMNGDHIRREEGTSFQNVRQITNLISILEEIHSSEPVIYWGISNEE